MADNKQFLVSVAEVLMTNPVDGSYIGKSSTLIDSSLAVTMASKDVNGGFGNQLQFTYFHTRELTATLTDAQFNLNYVALNVGSSIFSGLDAVYKFDETVVLGASGVGEVASVPVGANVFVKKKDGVTVTLAFSGSNFTVVGGVIGDIVCVTYQYNSTVEKVTIDAGSAPAIITLVMKTKLFDQSGLIGSVEITIPRYQVSGKFDLGFTSDGVTSSKLEGKALSANVVGCESEGVYAFVKVVKTIANNTYDFIAIDSSDFSLAVAGTKTLKVYGYRTGLYAPILIDKSLITFVSATPAKATITSAGLVTGVAVGPSIVTATLTSTPTLKDTLTVTVA